MADLAALHQAVIASPDDEAPRVAFADAIAASDPARAEFITLQLTAARWRRDQIEPEGWADAHVRASALRKLHGTKWASDIRDLVTGWQFWRGFPEEVTLDAAQFLATAPELYRRAPVRHLNLTGAAPVVAELFKSPHLTRLVSLRLDRNDIGDAGARALAQSPHLANLRWLDLSRNKIGPAGLDALASSDRLPNLRYLKFVDNVVSDPTPVHADEYDTDTALAKDLQSKHGPRPWLSAQPARPWPPERDAA